MARAARGGKPRAMMQLGRPFSLADDDDANNAGASGGTQAAVPTHRFWLELWARIAFEGAVLIGAVFVVWELLEPLMPASQLHALHLVRGVGAALLLGTWSFLRIRKARLTTDAEIAELMTQLEDRVMDRTRRLEAARLRERNLEAQVRHQEKMAALGMLTAGFAHDLGNPLASLVSEIELLEYEGTAQPEMVRESLVVLKKQVARMNRTLREMVDFARRRREDAGDVPIRDAIADSERLVRHDPRLRNVELYVDLPTQLPSVHIVEDHLILVLINILLNAADAAEQGRALRVDVTAKEVGSEVVLTIADNGRGMPPNVLASAKTPLFTTKDAHRGTGLGLSVCEDIVRSVGGRLDIASKVGSGTSVTIRLPIVGAGVGAGIRLAGGAK